VIHTTVINRTSFNGPGGINARPNRDEMAAGNERHFGATPQQASHESAAINRPAGGNGFRPAANAGRPAYQARPVANAARAQEQPRAQERPAPQAHPANGGGDHERR
jgi:hypothetical protein